MTAPHAPAYLALLAEWTAANRAAATEHHLHPIAACQRAACHNLTDHGQPYCHRHRDTRKDAA